jgi:hypothetical protein
MKTVSMERETLNEDNRSHLDGEFVKLSKVKWSGESMSRLRAQIPEIEFHEVKSGGHLAHYEFSEQINLLLINFLTK